MLISIIIVNYKVKYFLEQCLLSVIKASQEMAVEILVVDNNSTDGSKAFFTQKFNQIQFFWLEENLGFGKANNFVLAKAKGDYILFLNPDTIVEETILTKSLDFYAQHRQAGGLGVRMIDGSGNFLKESKRMLPDFSTSFFKMLGFSNIFPGSKIFDRYYAGQLKENETGEIDVLAGAYFMMPRHLALKLQGFDPDFFMYGEDVDLSYRIQKSGFKNYYFPEIVLLHFKGESTQKKSAFYVEHFYGAMQLFINKHFKERSSQPLIKVSIKLAAYFANLKIALSKNGEEEEKDNNIYEVILVGGAEDIFTLKSNWPAENNLVKPKSEVVITKEEAGVEILQKIKAYSKQNNNLIIFAEGVLSNEKTFYLMQQLNQQAKFLIHQKNSSALIGSSSKDSRGLVIPLNEKENL